jgi:hypothetical protein
MADENFTPAPVELASGVGSNSFNAEPTSEELTQQALDPQGFKQLQQGQDVQSMLNAQSPTPLGRPVTPPIAETLSNLGKVEPQQLAADSAAMTPAAPQQPSGVVSVLDKLPQPEQQAPNVMPQLDTSGLAGYQKAMQANNAIADATAAKAVADQAEIANAEKAYVVAEQKRAETKAAFDTDYNGKMAQYEQSIADYKEAAGDKVIPGQLLANMSTGQKIQSGIFMALSAYGSALSGQENQALKVINNAINQDIDAQKFNIDNKLKGARMGVEGSQYLVAQMRDKFHDDESATLAARAAMLSITQQHLNMNASKLDQATAGPKAQALNGQIQVQMDAVKAQLKQAQATQFMMSNLTGDKVRNLSDNELTTIESLNKGSRDRYVKGYGFAANSEQAKKFTEYAAEVSPAISGIERIQILAKDFNRVTDMKKRAEISTELAAVLGALRIPITGPGILTEKEKNDIKNDVIGDPTSITRLPSLMKAKLQTTLNKLQTDLANRGHIAGLEDSSFKRSSKSSTFKD